jgi:N-acetylneuraminic acid mutarotase
MRGRSRQMVPWFVTLAVAAMVAGAAAPARGAVASTWLLRAPLPEASANFATGTGSDGRVYVLDGEVPESVAYDPATNVWSARATMPDPRADTASASLPDGRILVIGGYDFACGGCIVSRVDAYSPSTDTWSSVAGMHTTRRWEAATTGVDGRVYVFGGLNDAGTVLRSGEVYDPQANAWTPLPKGPVARYGAAAVTLPGGRILVIGGAVGSGGQMLTRRVDRYDPVTRAWTRRADMPGVRFLLGAALGGDGRVYAVGGIGRRGAIKTVVAYSPRRNTWTQAPALHGSRSQLGVVAAGGDIYAIGGCGGGFSPTPCPTDRVERLRTSS